MSLKPVRSLSRQCGQISDIVGLYVTVFVCLFVCRSVRVCLVVFGGVWLLYMNVCVCEYVHAGMWCFPENRNKGIVTIESVILVRKISKPFGMEYVKF